MKATGIVRRIDDLGRVVIPKEIRRTMRIREGDPLEIYTEKDGEVIFKKYSPMGELNSFAQQICESMYRTSEYPAAVCDRDTVIAAWGAGKKEILDRPISAGLEQLMEQRSIWCSDRDGGTVSVTDREGSPTAAVAAPILAEGDVLGCVVLLERADGALPGETERKLTGTVAGFLGKQMEN